MDKSFTSKQIADFIGGKLTGDENIPISFIAPPMLATENILAIAFEKDHINAIKDTKALCVMVPEGITCEGKTYIQVDRPKIAMGKLLTAFYEPPEAPEGVHQSATVHPSVELGQNVSIGPGVFIGRNSSIGDNTKILANVCIGSNVKVGKDCLFHFNVNISDKVEIGNKVIIHNGTSIGSDGFSFITEKPNNVETARTMGKLGVHKDQHIHKIPNIGTVQIMDDVEIGANVAIDRGTLQNTIIGRNTKIDNLVHIAHNCQIGESCFVMGQVGLAGSAKIGNRCFLTGQVGVADNVTVGDDVILIAQAGVSKNIPAENIYAGTPAVPRQEFIKHQFNLKSITELKKRVKELEKENQKEKV
ncbi:MAG: UDP-3-O-(3-hydroxymyristoyl)glucosamine N-acyltransferase [Vampirovibrionia bacterium]